MKRQHHGLSKTNEYWAWWRMKDRCQNPLAKDFKRYGGRGISLCESWQTFGGFLADMGPRPTNKHSIDRIDVNGNYEPSNCRWATATEQQNNKRNTLYVNYQSKRMSVADAVRAAGGVVSTYRAYQRLKSGWDINRAVETIPNRETA